MKSEHRHELQQNELGRLARKLQPWFARHGMQVIAGVVAVLILSGVAIWWTSSSIKAGAAGWTKLSIAQSTEDFAAVAEKNADNLAGEWARLRSAEMNLENGILEMFTDRELALADLKRAKDDFEKVLASGTPLPQPMEERARFGLARSLETMCDGDTGPVVDAYKALLAKFPETVYKPVVEQKIKDLQSDTARNFYTWFSKEKPKPPEFKKPQDAKSTPSELELPPGPSEPKADESKPSDAPQN